MTDILFYVVSFIGIFPVAAFYLSSKAAQQGLSAIRPYLWLIFISSLYEVFATELMQFPTAIWFKLYGLLEMAALMYYFWKILGQFKVFFASAFGFYVITLLILLIVGIPPLASDGVLCVIELVSVYIAAILWFRDIFGKISETSLWDAPDFYFISGLVICLSGAIFLFLTANMIYQSQQGNFEQIWTLNIVFNLILRSLIVFGIWKAQQKSIRYYGQEQR